MFSEFELINILNQLLELPHETEWVEFKEAKNGYDYDDLGKYFSALSNEANLKGVDEGWLVFGVEDKARKIVGSKFRINRKDLDSLKHEIAKQTNGISFIEIYEINFTGKRVLMFQIPPAPKGIPTSWKRHFYGSDGESLTGLSIDEIEIIRKQITSFDWSAEICTEAAINDLDSNAVEIARLRFTAKSQNQRYYEDIKNWSISEFLDKAKLTRNSSITRAAILLLGKPESSHFLIPNPAQITWKLDTDEQAYEHFYPPFLLSIEDVFKRIRNINFRISPANRLIPIEIPKYDSKVVLEALNNCIAHQNYNQNARVIVTEKADRIILQNIGEFFDGSLDDYLFRSKTPEHYRNPFLVNAMVNLDMIDTIGSGIRKIYLEQKKRYLPLPEYDFSDSNHVTLTIYGKVIDENYSRILIEKKELSLGDAIVLDKIQKKQPVERNILQPILVQDTDMTL